MNRFVFSIRFLLGFLAIYFFTTPVSLAQNGDEALVDQTRLVINSRNLSLEQVKALEKKLKENEKDKNTRMMLLGYYAPKRFVSSSNRGEYNKHVLWLIQYSPEDKIHAFAFTQILKYQSPSEYEKGKKLWLEHLETKPKNLTILAHAAKFFTGEDDTISEKLYLEAEKLDPNNHEWSGHLGHLYALEIIGAEDEEKNKKSARKSLEAFQRAFNKTKVELHHYNYLVEAARVAFVAGELKLAQDYATKTLEDAKKSAFQDDLLHKGNTVLGLVALEKGDVGVAKQHLLDSGKVEGSAVLSSFGPTMIVADRLFKKGEKATVLEYLKLCSKFWKDERVTKWIEEVEKGKTPDFSQNIHY